MLVDEYIQKKINISEISNPKEIKREGIERLVQEMDVILGMPEKKIVK